MWLRPVTIVGPARVRATLVFALDVVEALAERTVVGGNCVRRAISVAPIDRHLHGTIVMVASAARVLGVRRVGGGEGICVPCRIAELSGGVGLCPAAGGGVVVAVTLVVEAGLVLVLALEAVGLSDVVRGVGGGVAVRVVRVRGLEGVVWVVDAGD